MEDNSTLIMSARALRPGSELHWYTIEQVLGQGGFGITYLAHDRNLERKVAIKEYLPTPLAYRQENNFVQPVTGSHSDKFTWGLKGFLKEAQTLAKFSHQNIVRVHSVFEHHNTAYMVMDYEGGQSLATVYEKRQGNLNQAFFEQIFFPIFDGLKEIHKLGFIHRDIKPGNIFIRANHTPVLIDFGSARETAIQQTSGITTLVTQGYTPLEQYGSGYGEQGPWTDIYALAATLYEGVVGSRPAESINRSACLLKSTPDLVQPLSTRNYPAYTQAFLDAMISGLTLEPEKRPVDLNHWLGEFYDSETTSIVSPDLVRRQMALFTTDHQQAKTRNEGSCATDESKSTPRATNSQYKHAAAANSAPASGRHEKLTQGRAAQPGSRPANSERRNVRTLDSGRQQDAATVANQRRPNQLAGQPLGRPQGQPPRRPPADSQLGAQMRPQQPAQNRDRNRAQSRERAAPQPRPESLTVVLAKAHAPSPNRRKGQRFDNSLDDLDFLDDSGVYTAHPVSQNQAYQEVDDDYDDYDEPGSVSRKIITITLSTLAGIALLGLLGMGGYQYLQKSNTATQDETVSGGASVNYPSSTHSSPIEAGTLSQLPIPDYPIEFQLPKTIVLLQLEEMEHLTELYQQAYTADPNNTDLHNSIQRSYQRLTRVARQWNADSYPDLTAKLLTVISGMPTDSEQKKQLVRLIENSDQRSDPALLRTQLSAGKLTPSTDAGLLDMVTRLSSEDRKAIAVLPEWQSMLSQYRQLALEKIKSSDFSTAADMIMTGLTLQSDDAQLLLLKEHLQQANQ